MDPDFFILLSLFAVCLAIRTSYEILKDARKVHPENKTAFGIVLVAMILLWVTWFAMCPVDPMPLALPGALKTAGFLIFCIGLALAVGALIQLRGVEHIDHLVTNGLFSFMRHPMYLGFVFWIIGWSVHHGALVSFGAGIVAIIDITCWARREDARLVTAFGDQYTQYRKNTWF